MAKELHLIKMQLGSLAKAVNTSSWLQAQKVIIRTYLLGQKAYCIDENSGNQLDSSFPMEK